MGCTEEMVEEGVKQYDYFYSDLVLPMVQGK